MADELARTIAEGDTKPGVVLEVLTSSLSGKRYTFGQEDLRKGVLLGRATDCHVRFDPTRDLKVSGHHALIEEREGRVLVRDQGSANGLYVNDTRVSQSGTPLKTGAKISLGQEGALIRVTLTGEPLRPGTTNMGGTKSATTNLPPQAPVPPPTAVRPMVISSEETSPNLRAPAAEKKAAAYPDHPNNPSENISSMVNKLGAQVGAGEKTKYLIKEVAEQIEVRAKRKSGALVTIVGALFVLLLAAGATGGWYYYNDTQNKAAEADKDKRDREEREKHDAKIAEERAADQKKMDDMVAAVKRSNEEIERLRAEAEKDRAARSKDIEALASKLAGSEDEKAAFLKRMKEIEENATKALASGEELKKLAADAETKFSSVEAKVRDEIRKEIEAARASGKDVPESSEAQFLSMVDKYNKSVFLVFVQTPMLNKDGERVGMMGGSGTGWLIKTTDKHGYVVTNKHVIKPYLFKPDLALSNALEDVHPDPDMKNWVIACWHSGMNLRTELGSSILNVGDAWAMVPGNMIGGHGGLRVLGFADDDLETVGDTAVARLTAAGLKTDWPEEVMKRVRETKIHEYDSPDDLCILQLDRNDPKELALPIPTADDDALAKLHQLEPVMSLGFPLGLQVIKARTVTTSPCTGVIRNLQRDGKINTIFISVPIMPGNSGGPLIDRHGRVIGITTRGFEATLAEAIYVDHARNLLKKLGQ
ncbi:MAG: trypsin-like peptidase domain-containing protein [Planctomycetes bacterium]|nr:trypsin-like peptidase domain-containing protein [Planctomycetota bacterium]